MSHFPPARAALLAGVVLLATGVATAQDWPQWRGPNRDNKIVGFTVPKTWPKTLTKKWKVPVGQGESSPVLVGDKIYVFGLMAGEEVVQCLDAGSGKEIWKYKYKTTSVTGGAKGHPGPRSTPVVADGKVCTFGVGGVLCCLDAASGNVVWRKDTKSTLQFFVSMSPLIVDGKCIAFTGGKGKGELTAFDLTSGDVKWKWTGDGPAYGSPVLVTIESTRQIVTLTEKSLVGIGLDGMLLWQTPYSAQYNSGTPIVDGQEVICSGPKGGTVAFKIEKKDGKFAATSVWKKPLASHQYSTPVFKDGMLFGLNSNRSFFCMDAQTGETLWTDPAKRGECGAILDAGPVLVALTSDSELVILEPNKKAFTEVAKYTVADSPSWSVPVLAGNRIYVKDRDSLILWTIE